jgi:NAD-dependent dihydropyrimidine dehydrogenase PreA subunit
MAKNWYPVIDYEKCIECSACFNKCSHGVYEKDGERPVVVAPEHCVDGCRGCQSLCPADAIQYIGDTGQKSNCGCCCNC